MVETGFDRERLEALAKAIWNNAGYLELHEKIGEPPRWEDVQNKHMWLRMAAAAALNIGVEVSEQIVWDLGVRRD